MRAQVSLLVAALLSPAIPQTAVADELTCTAASAEPWPQGFIKATLPDGGEKFIAAQRIDRISGADGADLTNRVLVDRERVEGSNLEICYREANHYHAPKLRGQPGPERDWFPVLQAGTLVRLDRHETATNTNGAALALDLGAMKNIGT